MITDAMVEAAVGGMVKDEKDPGRRRGQLGRKRPEGLRTARTPNSFLTQHVPRDCSGDGDGDTEDPQRQLVAVDGLLPVVAPVRVDAT